MAKDSFKRPQFTYTWRLYPVFISLPPPMKSNAWKTIRFSLHLINNILCYLTCYSIYNVLQNILHNIRSAVCVEWQMKQELFWMILHCFSQQGRHGSDAYTLDYSAIRADAGLDTLAKNAKRHPSTNSPLIHISISRLMRGLLVTNTQTTLASIHPRECHWCYPQDMHEIPALI